MGQSLFEKKKKQPKKKKQKSQTISEFQVFVQKNKRTLGKKIFCPHEKKKKKKKWKPF
jgi:hypothetical protein